MTIDVKMPALSPTMEQGTLTKWLVKEGDLIKAGDLIAEIETDKATMEFEAVDEGRVVTLLVPEGTDEVAVGTVIARITDAESGMAEAAPAPAPAAPEPAASAPAQPAAVEPPAPASPPAAAQPVRGRLEDRVKVSPLAARIAQAKGIDLSAITGTGPGGRIVRRDLGLTPPVAKAAPVPARQAAPATTPLEPQDFGIPHELTQLSNMRKTIARRLTQAKQTVPHIYLTVDVQLDKLLKLRSELNAALEGQGVKLSVNDLLIKALATSLMQVPECNVQFAGEQMLKFSRADISVAVSVPNGLITPIVKEANGKGVAAISTQMKDFAARAREGKLKPEEYQGGTASLSNMGMYGIKQFEAVINPPQAMIMACGAGEKRPFIVDDALGVATVMSATGSFDHRAIDGADGARLMQAFKALVENPLLILG
ncbi:Dihydrolipoamide acetyltransferase, long form [Sphingomonas paucimobilis]|nr:Dihydrolipoamide acetyltransferase, long form [Sphingomonas paucimobilis]